MISKETLNDLRNEITKIDTAISECSNDSGVCHPWMKYRLSSLVELRESFWASIKHLEGYGVGV